MLTKIKHLSIAFACIVLFSCKTTQTSHSVAPTAGMFKVSILYPNGDGKTFDMEYYEKKHMPMVAGMLGSTLKFYEITKGVAGRTPNDQVPFLAVGYFYINNVADYNKAIAQNREAIVGDFKNYTNIQPTVLISEVMRVTANDTK